MMHVGPEKAQIVNCVMKKHKPLNILEVGCYCGYSALLFAEMSEEHAMVHSLDINEEFVGYANAIINHSGMKNKINVHIGNVTESEEYLKNNGPFDLILIDH